jgi:hypothetical protein
MDRLLKHIHRVRLSAFCSRDFVLLHDNAPAHKAASVCQFMTPKNITTLYHPPYSPHLSPPDYFLSSKLKMKLKGLHFADVAEIQQAVSDEVRKVQKRNFLQLFGNCTTVRLYNCITVRLYDCTTVRLYNCTTVQLYDCITVRLYNCTSVQLYDCITIRLYNCTTV